MAIFVIILTIFAFLSVVCVKNTLNILKNDAGYVVVLDAGHGAPDGGVVGTNTGVLESDLNLKMVKILQNYLENAGVKVVLTRKNKYALSGGAKGFKKEDFKLRKEIIESVNPDAVISIHMNFYKAQPSRRGAQVFYDAKNPYSLPFAATLMQKSIRKSTKIQRTGICCAFGRLLYNKFDVRPRRNRGMRIFK